MGYEYAHTNCGFRLVPTPEYECVWDAYADIQIHPQEVCMGPELTGIWG